MAICSWPMYSSKASLPKTIPKTAVGSINCSSPKPALPYWSYLQVNRYERAHFDLPRASPTGVESDKNSVDWRQDVKHSYLLL